MSSPTQRALAECRKRGWTAQVVEKWVEPAKRRVDLFGAIDIVAITPHGLLGIQACAGASHAARMAKAKALPVIGAWKRWAGFAVWSYSKRGPRGKRKLWTLREEYWSTPWF